MSEMVERVGDAIQAAWGNHRDLPPIELTDDERRYLARAAIKAMREPAPTRAMAESVAVDDEGSFGPLLDILDFSGENKTHTVLRAAWEAGIDAALDPLETRGGRV